MTMRRTQTENPSRSRRPRRLLGLGAGVSLALALAGCANSPDSQFYTLSNAGAGAIATAGNGNGGSPLMIEMTPVNIPDQVARPQLVTTTGPGQVKIEDFHRWSGPLADEIGGALSTSLTRALPAIDVYRAPRPSGATVYQITVNVRRFESVPGNHATIDTVWSVVRSSDHLTMTCQTLATEPVSSGYDALIAGHRKALARVAADIGAAVQQERVEPVRMPSDTLETRSSAATGGKDADNKKPANAGLASTSTPTPAPMLLCPASAAPRA